MPNDFHLVLAFCAWADEIQAHKGITLVTDDHRAAIRAAAEWIRGQQEGRRRGGSARSEAKTRAVRENAKRGGWPKGKPRKLQSE